jgi:hypothetical protein
MARAVGLPGLQMNNNLVRGVTALSICTNKKKSAGKMMNDRFHMSLQNNNQQQEQLTSGILKSKSGDNGTGTTSTSFTLAQTLYMP